MASIIRIKRSSVSGNPSTLGAGELAYSALTDNGSNGGDRLYIGIGTETSGNAVNHYVIGGKFFTDRLDHTAGTLTANSAIVVDSDKKIDDLLVDNLELNGNTISSTNTNGNITLDPNGSGYVQISGTNGLVIPVGTTAQQGPAEAGAIRLNSETGQFEGYSGSNWASLGGVRSVDGLTYITAETTPGASDDVLTFVTDGTTAATLGSSTFDIDDKIATVTINATTAATNTSTGALVVVGGVGIGGELYVNGSISADSATFASINDTPIGDTSPSTGAFTTLSSSTGLTVTDTTQSTDKDTGAVIVDGGVGIEKNLNVGGNIGVVGDLTVGASGARTATTVYGTAVNITGSGNSTLGINATTASSITQIIEATNTVGDANLDVNVKNAFTLDATTISIDSTDTSNLSMAANSSSTKTLTINASNIGTGAAHVEIGSADTDEVVLTSSTKTTVDSDTEVAISGPSVNVDATTVDITTVGTGDSVTITSGQVIVNSDTITFRGEEGSGDVTNLTIAGELNVDNVKIDGNTISTTDGSNTLYLDPAPSGSEGLVVIEGNLQVNGTTTTINSTEVTIDDPIFVLGGESAPASDDNLDRGIEFQWHNGTSAKLGFFGYDDSASEFIFVPDATDTTGVISGTLGNAALGKLRLADTTASTTTNTGALTVAGGVGISGQLNVAGTTSKFTSTQASTTTTTGAVVIAGGLGIGDSIVIANNITGSGTYGDGIDPMSVLDNFDIDGGTY